MGISPSIRQSIGVDLLKYGEFFMSLDIFVQLTQSFDTIHTGPNAMNNQDLS
jgi:hypothetical protein